MGTTKHIVSCLFAIISSSVILCNANSASDDFGYEEHVRYECGFTRYPALCVQTLAGNKHVDFLSTLVNKTISETNLPTSGVGMLSSQLLSPDAQLSRMAIDYCENLVKMSRKRLDQSLAALQNSPKKNKDDIQTWLSAAITFQETCKDTIQDHLPTNILMSEIHTKMDLLSQLSSNTLALVNRITNSPTTKTRRLLQLAKTFPGWVSAHDRKLLQSTGRNADVIVAKDGSGNYKTISEAIRAASGGRYVIYVKAGMYNEKVNVAKDGITLLGDGKYSTIITGSRSAAGGSSLGETATFTVTGDGFIAKDIGFENTAGPLGHQAIALTVASDRSVFYRCSIAGYQDTLYALSLRQFYRECDIYGTIDFIFGNAAAVFQSCNIIFRRPRSGAAFNTILANGRTDPGQNTGYTVQNSRISVGSNFGPVKNSFGSYLGRPWKAYARSVVMQCVIDGVISPRGWVEWKGSSGSTYSTLYYAEFRNSGPGSVTDGRVNWPGFHVIGESDASKFTVGNFIGGNSWLPSTGVGFISGL